MGISVVLGALLLLCLYKFFRGAWWADQAMVGVAIPSLIPFVALGGPLGISLSVLAVICLALGSWAMIRYFSY